MNCGNNINYHSETSTDKCLRQLNEKMLNVFLFDSKKNNNPEEKGLTAITLQEIPHIIEVTRGNS